MVTSEGATDPLVDPSLPALASADPNSTHDNQNSGGGDGGKQQAATSGSKKRKDDSAKDKDKKPKKTRQTRTCNALSRSFHASVADKTRVMRWYVRIRRTRL